MKENTRNKVLKFLKYIIPCLILLFIYEISLGKYLSFTSYLVDSFFFYTSKTLFLLIMVLVSVRFILSSKNKIVKVFSWIIFIPSIILFLLFLPINTFSVINVSQSHKKYYFHQVEKSKYYMVSERFTALDGLELKVYKETPLFWFIKSRIELTEEDIKKINVDYQKKQEIYIKEYFRQH